MTITVQKDPRTKKEIIIAEGEVKAIYVNELKEVKTYSSGKGGPWTPTHRISVNIDGDIVFLGLTDKENEIEFSTFNAKDADDNWQEVEVGDTISAIVTESGEYKGKKQYSGKKSGIVFLEKGDGPRGGSKADIGGKGKTYDSKPIEAGNARSCAANWVSRGNAKMNKFTEVVREFVIVASKLRKEFSDTMSEYEAGVSVGQGCLAASLIVNSLEEVEEFVRNYVSTLIPKSLELIDDVAKGEAKADEAKVPTKGASKEESSKEEPPQDEEDDDDIPF